jgi:hypothetical protein
MRHSFVLLFFTLIVSVAKTQPFVHMSPGMTNGTYLSNELTVGYKTNNYFVRAGYIAMIDAAQPALFTATTGTIIKDRVVLFAGYTRVHKSNDYKQYNYDSWIAGAQYHFLHFDKGTFLIGANYSPGYFTMNIGMSYGLFR